ncbi:MAG: alpha/beta hydrolase [Acidimicrobiales bacterium]
MAIDATTPDLMDVPVPGGDLRVARWGAGPRCVFGIHGITASSVSWTPVVRHLGDEFTLLAPDLRGRGASAGLPGPFGLARHADDCAAVLDHLSIRDAIVAGQSMGAYVAVGLAARRPDLVGSLLLVDGGLPLPVPEGVDVDAVTDAILGPAVARLRLEFVSEDAYFDFWRGHPAFSEGLSDDVLRYLRYDLTGTPPTLRSRVSEAAVRADSHDTIANVAALVDALERVHCPITLLRAPRNLLNEAPPLLPDEVVAEWSVRVPQLIDEVVDDTNHYTIAFSDRGARVIARRIRETPVSA